MNEVGIEDYVILMEKKINSYTMLIQINEETRLFADISIDLEIILKRILNSVCDVIN
jgi:hypothetical protein